MATDLTNVAVSTGYVQLLHIDGGVGGSATRVYDGDGTGTPLEISTTEVVIKDGSFNLDVASHDGTNGLKLGGTLVTTSAAELNLLDGITAGTVSASKFLLVDSNKDLSGLRNLTGTGTAQFANFTATGNTSIGDAVSDTVAVNATITTNLVFEGSTANAYETTLAITDPTADRTWTIPDSTDTFVGRATTDTLTNKTLTAPDINTPDIDGGTVDAITSLTVANNVDIGSYDLRAGTLTADGLTSGRVVFASTNGVLSDDSDLSFSGATLSATNLTSSGTVTYGSLSDGSITITAFVDEDGMDSNSATLVPTQQSVKAYVDAQVTAQDLDFSGDSGGALNIDLDSESLTLTGGTGVVTVGSGNTMTFNSVDSEIVHDSLSGFVANEHIDHTAVTLTAGVGLSGGGTIAANRTFTVDLNELTTETTIADADFIAMVDATDDGSGKITFENLEDAIFSSVSGDVLITEAGVASIQANSVALATDTTGDYVQNITAGTGLTSTGATSGENIAHSLSVDASQAQVTTVGTLNSGAISSGFGAIDIGSSNLTTTGTVSLGATSFSGAIDFNSQNMTEVDIDSGTIDGATIATSNITVGSGKTLDVSAGTLTLAANQISGDKVEGGTIAATTISSLTTAGITASANIDIGGYDLRAATITADGLTSGRVVFAGTNGVLSDDSDLTFSGSTLTATNVAISGTLTTTGSVQEVSTTNLNVEDPLILLNKYDSQPGNNLFDAGIIIKRGSSDSAPANVGIIWDESADTFSFVDTSEDGTTAGNVSITDYENLRVGALTADDASTLATGSTIGNLTLANGSITDSSGAISFGDENLSTTGTFSAEHLTSTDDLTVSGLATIGETLGVTGVATFTAQSVHNGGLSTGALVMNDGTITDTSGAISFGDENLTTSGTLGAGVVTATGFTIGDAVITETELEILDGLTVTTAELNIMDGSATTQATVTLAGTDGVVISDGDVMKQALVSDFEVYMEANLDTMGSQFTSASSLATVGALSSGSIASGFGAISTGNAITTTGVGTFASLDISGDVDVDGTLETDVLTINGSALNYKAFGTSSIMFGDTTTGTIDGANYNTGLGVDIFAALTTGDSNVAIGFAALDALTTGQESVAIGSGALGAMTTDTGNVAVGHNALLSHTTSDGGYNVAIGWKALDASTDGHSNIGIGKNALGVLTTADNNTAIGTNALALNTSGTRNTAIGATSLDTNSTGNYNTAVGQGSLHANTTASQNTALGDSALYTNTTGSLNTAVGQGAMYYNTTGANNVALGVASLEANTTGTSNVAVGALALDANTTADNNTAVGYVALGANTTGAQNTAIGMNALLDNTTGADNTALGTSALANNTTASNNTAVGRAALELNTTGEDAVAIGSSALGANTTGNNNIAIGYQALYDNTTGSYNTAIGWKSLFENTTAIMNVAVGYDAMRDNTTGANNVAIGVEALANNTTAANNTAVGYTVLTANTTGTENNALGANAGDSITTGSYNIAIGNSALAGETTGNRSVAIGRRALLAQNFTGATDAYNVAVGFEAGNDITTGLYNTLIGGLAGDKVTDGDDNTFIGYSAGAYSNQITTGGSNTIIGAYARASSASVSSELAIGRYVLGQGSSTATVGINSNGATISIDGSATSWAAHSDERLKENITSSTAGLSFINDLRPVTYNWKAKNAISEEFTNYYDADSTAPVNGVVGKTYHGFVAQEMKATIDAHAEVENGNNLWAERVDDIQHVAPGHLVPMLVKAIQELSSKVEELEKKCNCD